MTTKSLLHSNAFNFLSFIVNSVDPRTGQYTLAIELPELVANNLAGPSLPLRIGFNPMNIEDSGFGSGWTLNLSQYTPPTTCCICTLAKASGSMAPLTTAPAG